MGIRLGDVVLQTVAQRLSGAIRQYDWIGRYGGEEFMAIINAGINDDLAIVGERLRAAVADKPVPTQNGELNITSSGGIAISPIDGPWGCDALVAAADRALYRAKRNGRNRVESQDAGHLMKSQLPAPAARSLEPGFLV